ncbi:MAG: long-chain fatty acid--CoA ligase [Cytophagaceae bacterium]|nr:long-chain fatty acid--CoA ligase [Cytophagaceae bacterium]MDW8456052.1 long-chain fatty acid--CoA ligase [Cytophagaceae bacterium]
MEVTRLFDLLDYQLQNYPKEDCLAGKVNGQWKKYSTQQVKDIATQVSLGLLELGIRKDDKVAIISYNMPEWNFVDFGIQQIGAISVPIYPTITEADYKFIFDDSETKIIFVENEDLYIKAKNASKNNPNVKEIYTLRETPGRKHWKEVAEMGSKRNSSELEPYKAAVKSDDLLTIIYTSGTTGTPKGVMLTHANIISNYKACIPLMPIDHTHRALSFLYLCHIYERMLCYLYMAIGASIYYAESMETIGDNLKEVRPHMFTTVPRLLEKVYDKIVTKGSELKGIKRALFFWALNLGLRYNLQGGNGFFYDIQLALANKIIFSKWRAALGGNIKAVVSGSAPLQPRLARVFWAARIPIMEGYGLTETSPVISVNRVNPKENRIGTVGPIIDGIEVKIAEDGEILTRGPHVMKGYYKRPDLTEQVIDKDGWLHTGDIGEFVEGKYLKITDRKKEMFKTSGGKYIAPQVIENKFKESRFIEQIMVVGEGQKFPGALIVPAFDFLKSWCQQKGIPYTTDAEMIKNPQVLERYQKEVDTLNENFAQFEKIKKFVLMPRLWTIEDGELTPTLKVKRKAITAKNQHLIDGLYA